jgi:5-hydroxyisourate hydrolase-like protein (transthyretin family)
MKPALFVCLILTAVLMTGCGRPAADIEKDLAASKQEVQALKDRVAALEGRVQAMEASLPVSNDQ